MERPLRRRTVETKTMADRTSSEEDRLLELCKVITAAKAAKGGADLTVGFAAFSIELYVCSPNIKRLCMRETSKLHKTHLQSVSLKGQINFAIPIAILFVANHQSILHFCQAYHNCQFLFY